MKEVNHEKKTAGIFGWADRYAHIGVVNGGVSADVSPLEVYFMAPEADYSDYLYIVVKHDGLGGQLFYQYTYEWQN